MDVAGSYKMSVTVYEAVNLLSSASFAITGVVCSCNEEEIV
jgi:hypothetical protein